MTAAEDSKKLYEHLKATGMTAAEEEARIKWMATRPREFGDAAVFYDLPLPPTKRLQVTKHVSKPHMKVTVSRLILNENDDTVLQDIELELTETQVQSLARCLNEWLLFAWKPLPTLPVSGPSPLPGLVYSTTCGNCGKPIGNEPSWCGKSLSGIIEQFHDNCEAA